MKVNALPTNKCSPVILGFLKLLGWKVINGWRVSGVEEVEIWDQQDVFTKIPDLRFKQENEDEYMKSYWNQ